MIFQDRLSEGYATQNSRDQSPDSYFCLSFTQANAGRDALDAVTCASVFFSDKGRYVTQRDVETSYAEPFESAPGVGSRCISAGSSARLHDSPHSAQSSG